MMDFRPSNPNLPPDWRWQIARHVAETGESSAFRMDRHCLVAKRFAERLVVCASERELLDLSRQYPDVFEAFSIFNDARARRCRSIIEARLLAGQSDEEIAKRSSTRMTPQTVAYFEKFFFSVRAELRRRDYILSIILPEAVHRGSDATDFGAIWKLFAYYGGPDVLEVLLHHSATSHRPDGTRESVSASLKDGIQIELLVKAAIAVRTMPISGQTREEVIKLFSRMQDAERKREGGDMVVSETFLAACKSFLESVPWRCGANYESPNPFVAKVDASAQTLRADELLACVGGHVPPGLETLLASAKFPETQPK